MLEILQQQAKPRKEREITWMCRLCGDYNVKLRKAHLIKVHGASSDRMQKRAMGNILYEIFGRPNK